MDVHIYVIWDINHVGQLKIVLFLFLCVFVWVAGRDGGGYSEGSSTVLERGQTF